MEKKDCKNKAAATANHLPGSIYARNGRYWWKVQLPGQDKPIARPLKNIGAKFATTDPSAAVELAKNLYQQAIYQNQNQQQNFTVTNIASLVKAYLNSAEQYYRDPEGNPTKEISNTRYSFKPLTELLAALPVDEFGPLKLIEVRNRMIVLKRSRKIINERINRIRRMFKWAVSRQLVSPILHHGLVTVEGLKRGRSAAIELEKRKPAEEQHIYAVLPFTTPVVATMIELQLLTGMRPGELVIMRPCDIDRTGKVWRYYPSRHKTQYRGDERIVSIGPLGQEILRPYLLRPAESCCFSPEESEQQRLKLDKRLSRLAPKKSMPGLFFS